MLKEPIRQTTFWNAKIRGIFSLLTYLLLKCGLRINATNYFKDQRRPSIRRDTVMFRGTPCTSCFVGHPVLHVS